MLVLPLPGAAAPMLDVACGANAQARLLETSLYNDASWNNITFFLCRPTAIGTRTTPTALIPEDPDDTTQTDVDAAVAWSVNPTNPTNNLKSFKSLSSAGGGCEMFLRWDKGLVIPANGSILWRSNVAVSVLGQGGWVVDR